MFYPVQGPWGVRVLLPIPRLPRAIGSNKDLKVGDSIYPSRVNLDVPITPFQVTLVAGAVASSTALDSALLPTFSRFSNLFREYAIVGARLELRLLNVPGAAQGGFIAAALDESSNAAPTATILQAPHVEMMCSGYVTEVDAHLIDWKASDVTDLDWTITSTNLQPVWLKIFAATATTLTAAGNTASVLVTGALALSFRGYAGA